MKRPVWQERDGGTLLPVRAQPGAKKNELRGIREDALIVAVTQVAEKGKANRAIIATMAKTTGLRKSNISLCSGETSRQKIFFIADISAADLWKRIAKLIGEPDDE